MAENFSFRSSMNGFNRNDVIAYIDTILKEKAECAEKLEEAQKEIEELKAANETLKSIIVDETEKNKVQDKCSECEVSKLYEARLGAAMLDAKRFSEIIVKEANDKATGLFEKAYDSATATSEKAKSISKSIADINNQFNIAFKVLLDNMNSLGNTLDSFKGDVKSTGAMFDFSTDFSEESKSQPTVASDNETVLHDVNFDDADEYDFRVDVNV